MTTEPHADPAPEATEHAIGYVHFSEGTRQISQSPLKIVI